MEGQDDDFDERVEPIAVILTAFVPRYLWKSCPHSFRMSRQFDEFQCKIGWSRVEIFFVRRPKGPIFTAQASGGAAKAHRIAPPRTPKSSPARRPHAAPAHAARARAGSGIPARGESPRPGTAAPENPPPEAATSPNPVAHPSPATRANPPAANARCDTVAVRSPRAGPRFF